MDIDKTQKHLNNRIRKILLLTTTFIILVDLISMRGMNKFLEDPAPALTNLITYIHWGISIIFLALIVFAMVRPPEMKSPSASQCMFTVSGIFVLLYIPKTLFVTFIVLDELFYQTGQFMSLVSERFIFFSYPGIALTLVAIIVIAQGMSIGKRRLQIRKFNLNFNSFPESLNHLKIVHISDLHFGSISPKSGYPRKIVNRINALNPDIVLFTGDLINNVAAEAEPWIEEMKNIQSQQGKFSIMGNHDYGEYVTWESEEARREDHQKLEKIHHEMGFRLLSNESVQIGKNGETVGIAGVENWGLPPFPQYGNLEQAMEQCGNTPFQILMTHDPSHWEQQVKGKTTIGLTLSGHTHGFQFGIFSKKFKWSPVQYKYSHWAGLYTHGKQYLHVSKGLGYIGFPGRIGMPPDIALITIRSS